MCQQQEEQRSTAAREAWGRRHAWAVGQLDSSIWLEAVGARALASEENSRSPLNLAMLFFRASSAIRFVLCAEAMYRPVSQDGVSSCASMKSLCYVLPTIRTENLGGMLRSFA